MSAQHTPERLCMLTPDGGNETVFVSRKKAAEALRAYRRNGFVRRDQDMRFAYWLTSVFGERHHLDTWGYRQGKIVVATPH